MDYFSFVFGGSRASSKRTFVSTTAKSFIFCHWTTLPSSCLSFWILISCQNKMETADYSDPPFPSNLFWSCPTFWYAAKARPRMLSTALKTWLADLPTATYVNDPFCFVSTCFIYLFFHPYWLEKFRLSLASLLSAPFFAPRSCRYSRAIYHADLTVSFVVGHQRLPRRVISRVRIKANVRQYEKRCDQKGKNGSIPALNEIRFFPLGVHLMPSQLKRLFFFFFGV